MNPKLYVGNLPPDLTEADVRLLFSRIGDVTEVQLVLDPATQHSRGHAFVTMATAELAAAALNALHSHSLGGRYIVVMEARPAQEPKGLISEGFDLAPASLAGRGGQRDRTRRGSSQFPRRRNRKG